MRMNISSKAVSVWLMDVRLSYTWVMSLWSPSSPHWGWSAEQRCNRYSTKDTVCVCACVCIHTFSPCEHYIACKVELRIHSYVFPSSLWATVEHSEDSMFYSFPLSVPEPEIASSHWLLILWCCSLLCLYIKDMFFHHSVEPTNRIRCSVHQRHTLWTWPALITPETCLDQDFTPNNCPGIMPSHTHSQCWGVINYI